MDERRKKLELFAKQLSEGLPFAEGLIKTDADIENNALLARNLSEDALAHQVLKNTGIPIPDNKTSPMRKEDFLNRIIAERYPEFKNPNLIVDEIPDAAGDYYKGKIRLDYGQLDDITKATGKALHEAGHRYDDEVLGFEGENLKLKTLRDAKKKGLDLKKIDPAQVYEIYAKNHHAEIPKLREGSFGLGALKSMMKTGTFKALPVIGTAATAAAALSSPDASAAALDIAVPGGVESLGPARDSDDAIIENPQASPELRKQALQRLMRK